MSCNVGEVLYKGYCVPSYFTQAQMEQYYQQQLQIEAKEKRKSKLLLGILILASICGAGLYYLNFVL